MLDSLFAQDALLFTVPALFGTAVFILKIGLLVFSGLGGDVDVDADVDVDVDVVADGAEGGHGDSTAAFKMVSIHSIAAFIMGFGWGGLIGYQTLEWSLGPSILAGIAFGGALMWLLGILLKAVYDLQISGHVRIDDAMGRDGMVYASVPGADEGRGKVRVVIGDRARFFDAVSDGAALPTNTRVRVTGVNSDNTLTVSRA